MVSKAGGCVIRIAAPDIADTDLEAVASVLRSGQLVQGPHVAEFERRLMPLTGASQVVAVANCTAALHLTLVALGVGSGDTVAVSTYSWPATANAIVLAGATPVFVDIDPATFNMDPAALSAALSERKAKAVLVVHAFGGMANMPRILEVAERAGAIVVEDAACALGARLEGRTAGTWGRAACFSFHPRKAVTTGEGGAIATDDQSLARCLRALRNHGQDPNATSPDFILAGYNLRMTEFQAALGTGQLGRWTQIIAARREAAAYYDRLLASTGCRVPRALERDSHTYQSYVVLLPEEAVEHRKTIIASMRESGIEVTIGTYHIPLTTFYRTKYGYRRGLFPVTDSIAERALALPLHSKLSPDDQERVVRELVRNLSPLASRT
jgi:dTDP-4-amino-4,6-dideoxygalactose transaminase